MTVTPTPAELRLRVELRAALAREAHLADRVAALQDANEAAYRAAYEAACGPQARPVGSAA